MKLLSIALGLMATASYSLDSMAQTVYAANTTNTDIPKTYSTNKTARMSLEEEIRYFNLHLDMKEILHFRKFIGTVKVDKHCNEDIAHQCASYRSDMKLSNDSSSHTPNRIEYNKIQIYFDTDSCRLTPSDSLDMKIILPELMKMCQDHSLDRILIEAHSDKRPPKSRPDIAYEYNMNLSRKRAEAVMRPIKEYFKEHKMNIPIAVVTFGDANPVCHGDNEYADALNRVVNIIPNRNIIQGGLDILSRTKIYGDASGSMGELNKARFIPWETLKNWKYNCNDSVHIFTEKIDGNRGIIPTDSGLHIKSPQLYPFGKTPLKEVLLYVALTAEKGSKVVFITDGETTENNKYTITYDEITKIAQYNKISISFISTTLSGKNIRDLNNIAMYTGGQMYAGYDICF